MSDKRAFGAKMRDDLNLAASILELRAEEHSDPPVGQLAAQLRTYAREAAYAAGRDGQPVAWRRWTDSAYERRPRWVYFDEPADGAEPLFTHPAPKADASVPTIEVGYEGNASMTGIHISDETWASVAKLKARTAETKSDAAAVMDALNRCHALLDGDAGAGDGDDPHVELCPRPINGADCESAAWCVLSGNCGCDHGMKILLRTARGIDAAFSDDAQQRRDAWKRVDELEAECSRLRNDLSEAIFQRDLARTDANEEARCADELNKQLNGAAREVKALRAMLGKCE